MRGTYTLLLVCREPFRRRIGSLGYANVDEGYYLYTGSALGTGALSLEGRLMRHSRLSKKARWHVDYLTSDSRCRVMAAVFLRSRKRLECVINQAAVRKLNAEPVLPGAGSSDCECDGHLTKVGSSIRAGKILSLVRSIYRGFGRSVSCIQLTDFAYKNAPTCHGLFNTPLWVFNKTGPAAAAFS